MLYKLAHIIQERFGFIWDLIDIINSILFSLRYGSKMRQIPSILQQYEGDYKIILMSQYPTDKLVDFFSHQSEDTFRFFKPHGFDAISLKKLQRNKSFLAFLLIDAESSDIAGYCFNRCFFHGKGFRGRMVDCNYRGKGLGTMMNKILNDVGFGIGLRLFETVSKDNIPSYRSAVSASNFRILKEFPNNELYLEILNNKNTHDTKMDI